MESQTPTNPVRSYLEQITEFQDEFIPHQPVGTFRSVEHAVLKMGRQYAPAPLTKEELAAVRIAQRSVAPRMKDCFRVATHLSWELAGAVYVEGFATSGLLSVHHAWVDYHGKVIDLTWRRDKRGKANPHGQQFIYGVWPDGWDYFGVPIPDKVLAKILRATGMYGVLMYREHAERLSKAEAG